MSVNGEMFATKSPNDECAAHLIMISFKISKRSEFAQTFVLSENKLILLWLSLYEQLKDIKEEIINRRRIYNVMVKTKTDKRSNTFNIIINKSMMQMKLFFFVSLQSL